MRVLSFLGLFLLSDGFMMHKPCFDQQRTTLQGINEKGQSFNKFPQKVSMAETNVQMDTVPNIRESALIGGEWAGWECKFSQSSGTPMPIPEDYIPDDLLEWGVEVLGFEVLTSENLLSGEGAPASSLQLYRKRGMVFPETGCALDNLKVQPTTQEQTFTSDGKLSHFNYFPEVGYAAQSPRQHPAQVLGEDPASIQLETCLDLSHESSDGKLVVQRARVCMDLDLQTWRIKNAVQITKERKYGEFDNGQLYKDGGLDTKTLTNLIGAQCFAEKGLLPPVDGVTEAEGIVLFKGGFIIKFGDWELFPLDVKQQLISLHGEVLNCENLFGIEVGWVCTNKSNEEVKQQESIELTNSSQEKGLMRIFDKTTMNLVQCVAI